MKKADIKTGFLCNNNCVFCVQGHKKKFGDKDESEIERIIREAKKDCDIVVFTGGEPTIRKDILDLVRLAKRLKFKTIQIQSNGRMFSSFDFCNQMVKAGANEFALALHGHSPELHNWLTGAKSFAQTVSGIKNLKNLGQRVITNTVITKSNYRHLPEIAKILVSLDVDQFQFAFVHAIGEAAKNFDSVVPRLSLVAPYVKKGLAIGNHFDKRAFTEGIPVCFLEGFENHISENVMPDIKIFDLDRVVADFGKVRVTQGKSKGAKCKKCKYFKICEGSWKEYPEKFGWEEFEPVQKQYGRKK